MAKVNEYIPIHYVGRRHPVGVDTGSETIVDQSHKEMTNINKIVSRYLSGAQLPNKAHEGQYGDVSEIGDFMDVRETMNAALAAYDDLPNSITDQFNDAGEFVEYVERQRQADAKRSESSDNGHDTADQGGISDPKSGQESPPGDPPETGENQTK